jgi:uroporphyrinogen-III synthase
MALPMPDAGRAGPGPGPEAAPTVVVTRPLAQAAVLQQKIAASGRHAVLFPLLDILPLADSSVLDAILAELERFALAAFVSPNAIDAAFARQPVWPTDVALAVMGEGSRQALAAHGITDATHRIYRPRGARTDSQTLLEALDLPALAGRQALILRGESGRELLGEGLRAAGVLVTQVAAYRRAAPVADAAAQETLARLLANDNQWIITSSEALRFLVAMVTSLPIASGASVSRLQQQILIVPHVRIAETARSLGFCNVLQCASGDESILAALQFQDE